MAQIKQALIIGGGFSGMAAAIELRKRGIAVDLVEIDRSWRSYGAGLTVSGPTLRALGALGVLPQVRSQGFCADDCDVCAADGQPLTRIPTPRIAGPDVPGGGGIMRPVLAAILSEVTRSSGTAVRLGCTFAALDQSHDKVNVTFSDETHGEYDLVIGADGLHSAVRTAVMRQSPMPRYTGQGVWRAVVPRPTALERPVMFMGAHHKAGFNPVSQQQMYLFLTEDRPTNERVPDGQLVPQLSALLMEFSAPMIQQVRASLNAYSQVIYRPLEAMLLPLPWVQGRIVLIGDAAHATTPHLASGAGIGIEDALVLAQELQAGPDVPTALDAFQKRRFERCRLVVENSLRLGEIERIAGSQSEHSALMRSSMAALLAPI
jgi:2-polyprenyl-6-methoxyphenol hydroxylase-like FAD-dependent oxidoreductase